MLSVARPTAQANQQFSGLCSILEPHKLSVKQKRHGVHASVAVTIAEGFRSALMRSVHIQ